MSSFSCLRRGTLSCAALLLAGCAGFSPDGGFDTVATLARERTGQTPVLRRGEADAQATGSRIAELQSATLTPEGAVEWALLANRGLQARYAALGVAEADLVQAGRLANPTLGFSHVGGGGNTDIDRSFTASVLGLLTLPVARDISQRRFEQAQLQAALDTVELAERTRAAFYRAVAARQLAGYAQQVQDASDASAELGRRMLAAGNFSRLAALRQQAFQTDATARLARACEQATARQEELVRLLGGATGLRLPERLPELPASPTDGRQAEQTALDQRLDVRLARQSSLATARSLGLVRSTRFIDVLELGYANKGRSTQPLQEGYAVSLSLPLFDLGDARTARAEALYRQSLDRTAQVAVDARSEARQAYAGYRAAYALARHYRDEVVPLRKRISEENLLRYNGMLIGVFELLADAREQVGAVSAAIEAQRDFWLADTQLRLALTGASPSWPSSAFTDR